MTIPTHVILGVLIGKITGDFPTAIAVSVLVDIDHLVSYVRHGVLTDYKKFLNVITDKEDPYGDQRGYLHNILIAGLLSALSFLVGMSFGLVFTLSYFGHLLLDALDKSDYWSLFPYKKINIRWPIEYYSYQEILLMCVLIVAIIFLPL